MTRNRPDMKELYYSTTLKELAENYSSIPWMEWVRSLLPSTIILTENEPVLTMPNYIIEMQKLLNATSKKTVANYMYWRIIDSSLEYLNEKIRGRKFNFSPAFNVRLGWKRCVVTVTKSLPISAGALYVKNYFNKETKIAVLDMTANIKTAFRKTVEKVNNKKQMKIHLALRNFGV